LGPKKAARFDSVAQQTLQAFYFFIDCDHTKFDRLHLKCASYKCGMRQARM